MARATNGVMMALGTVSMWGFSPAFDIQQLALPSQASDEPLRVLLVGPGDVRHMLQTIASRRRHGDGKRPLHIYVYERSVETLARHFLLLQIAQDWELPLRQRVNTFLEVFGNALVQERTSAYIEAKAKMLIDLFHYERGWLADQVDLGHLKMRTRDEVVDTFRSWFHGVQFDMAQLRDHRLRHYYEVRYDYRNNLIDWDYTMNLKKVENASVIHIKQFREWRNTGIAFEFGDQSYTEPNRSMAAYTEARKKNHGAVLCRGVWTDVVIGPYVSFGVKCDTSHKLARQLFDIHNKGTGVEQNRHNTTEVAVYNVLSFMYEMETGRIYTMKKPHDVYSGIGKSELDSGCTVRSETDSLSRIQEVDEEDTDNQVKTESDDAKGTEQDARDRAKAIVESFEGVKVIPLTGDLNDLYSKQRYRHTFDHVFVSSQYCHTIQRDGQTAEAQFACVLKDEASVSVESPTFLLPLTENQRVLYVSKLVEMARAQDLEPLFPFADAPEITDLLKIENTVLQFRYTRKK